MSGSAPQHGNRVLPNRSAVISSYTVFYIPSDTFVDPEGDAITYSATGMPGGFKFNAPTRQFYGTPSTLNTAKDYPITVNATSVDGTDTLQFTLHLGAVGRNAPIFGADPAGDLYSVGPYIVGNNASINTTIGQPVTATDAGGNLLPAPYSIKWSSDNSVGDAYGINRSPIAINATTGQLYVNGTIDYNTKSQYTLIVEAEDTTLMTNVAKVVINVNPAAAMWCFTPPPVMILNF